MNTDAPSIGRRGRRIESLTGARFLAIMVIVFSHFEFLKEYGTFGKTYWNWWHNPTMGVDFFFMLSGFGMMLSSINRDPSGTRPVGGLRESLKFGVRHVKKIYPIYFTMLLVGIPYELLSGLPGAVSNVSKEIGRCFICFLLDLTLVQAATGRMVISHSLNGVSWFLSSIFCIYLVSPFIMQWLKRHVQTIRAGMISLALCIVLAFLLAILFSDIDEKVWLFDDLCYGSPYRRVFYVVSGMLLAQIYSIQRHEQFHRVSAFFSSGAFEYISTAISIIWFFWRNLVSDTYYIYIIDMAVVACDLFSMAICKGKISHFLEKKPMVYLGDLSMYIFITHYLIGFYVDFFVKVTGIGSLPIAIGEVVFILALTSFIAAWLKKKSGKLAYFDYFTNIVRNICTRWSCR